MQYSLSQVPVVLFPAAFGTKGNRSIALRPFITRDFMTGINISMCTSKKICNISMCTPTFYSPPPFHYTRCHDWYQYVHMHVYKIYIIYIYIYICASTFYSPPPFHYTRFHDWYQYMHVHVYKMYMIYVYVHLRSIGLRPSITRDSMTGINISICTSTKYI